MRSSANPLFLRDEELHRGIALLFFAWRDFTILGESLARDARIAGLGPAHLRLLYFVGLHPGLSVSDLLGILRITKQSAHRLLQPLLSEHYLRAVEDQSDRRRRLLHLEEKGLAARNAFLDQQSRRMLKAYSQAGADSVQGFIRVLTGLVASEQDRRRILEREPRRF